MVKFAHVQNALLSLHFEKAKILEVQAR